jgi:hypothetical protein
MRPGLPVDQILEAGVGVRVNVSRGGRVLATSVPAQDVTLDFTSDSTTPATLTFIAPAEWEPKNPGDPLNNFGQRVQVIALMEHRGQVTETEIGWFQISAWSHQSDGTVKITAVDLWTLLVDNQMGLASSPPSGATLRSELQRFCVFEDGVAGIPVVLDGVDDFTIDRTLQWGVERHTNVADLCAVYGLDYAVRPDGCLHVSPTRGGSEPDVLYTANDLLAEVSRESTDRRANRFIVVGSSGSGGDAKKYVGTAAINTFPFEPEGYGVVTSRQELSSATSQALATQAAQQALRDSLYVAESRSIEIVSDPRIEKGDILALVAADGEALTVRVMSGSITYDDPSKTMRIDVEVLQW